MTTTASHHDQQSRTAPLLASAAVLGAVAVGAVIGVAIQHHTGVASPARPNPPAVSYPGSAVFDNQPAGGGTTPRDDLKRPGQLLTDRPQLSR